MKISAKAEYACLALLALAQSGRAAPPLRIRDIARSRGIPERYLVQILLLLKGAGLVASTRGASGGYRLARPAADINLREVLSAIDGPDLPLREPASTPDPSSAHPSSAQVLAGVWEEVRQAERCVLERTTLALLAAQATPQDWII